MQYRLIALTLTIIGLAAAEGPNLGDKDFYPSDEHPVGFRGDGNGHFPGATPPLNFQEGTAVRKDIPDTGKKGDDAPEPKEHWVLTDNKAVNLCWKTEMPGWGNTQPIIVGDRVYVKGDPHWLVCVSLDDGKILWQTSNSPLLFDGKKHSEQEIADYQSLFNFSRVCQALSYVVHFDGRGKNREERLKKWLAENLDDVKSVRQTLDKAKSQVAKLAPDLVGEVEEMITVLQSTIDKGTEPNLKGGFEKSLQKELRIPTRGAWSAMVGWSVSAPVSDGAQVYAHFGQEQVVCYDLDGELRWGRLLPARDLGAGRVRVQHLPSPLLIGQVLVVQAKDYLAGLDKATGQTLWEADVSVGSGYNVGTHKHLTLHDGDTSVDIIATTNGVILRASDGKVLAELPFRHGKEGGGPSVIGVDDVIVFEKYRGPEATKNGPDYWRGRLVLKGDTVTLTEVKPLENASSKGGPSSTPILANGMVITQERAWDLATGAVLSTPPRKRGPDEGWASGFMVADGRVIWPAEGDLNGYHRGRTDNLVMLGFRQYDLSGRTSWKLLSDGNVLGGENMPRHAAFEEWLPGYYKKKYWHNYALPAQWGCYNSGGMFFQGNRAVIRSVSHLYCIGKGSYNGTRVEDHR